MAKRFFRDGMFTTAVERFDAFLEAHPGSSARAEAVLLEGRPGFSLANSKLGLQVDGRVAESRPWRIVIFLDRRGAVWLGRFGGRRPVWPVDRKHPFQNGP
ncbi:MAG: hypothetical protein CM1200mP29_10570 [Verrucomicrobiota bacterium]|nr:MAG: hypothetical protein CM1200mP29_10570 [Verrucomicrobiota bacterium]